jgi:hypothetical protein
MLLVCNKLCAVGRIHKVLLNGRIFLFIYRWLVSCLVSCVLRHKSVSYGTVLCHCQSGAVCLSGISVLGVLPSF